MKVLHSIAFDRMAPIEITLITSSKSSPKIKFNFVYLMHFIINQVCEWRSNASTSKHFNSVSCCILYIESK